MTALAAAHDFRTHETQPPAAVPQPLSVHVRRSMEFYFSELNGQEPARLYELVLSQVEQPLLEVVMHQTQGNISRAAQFLGMNRATLRKKLNKYGLTE